MYVISPSTGLLVCLLNLSAHSFTPGLAILGQWFRHRRGLVLGIVGAGSSGGGVVYPIMLQKLIPKVGFPWAVRITAFTALLCLSVACMTLKPRLPLNRKVAARNIIDLGGFRDPQYTLAALGSFLSSFFFSSSYNYSTDTFFSDTFTPYSSLTFIFNCTLARIV